MEAFYFPSFLEKHKMRVFLLILLSGMGLINYNWMKLLLNKHKIMKLGIELIDFLIDCFLLRSFWMMGCVKGMRKVCCSRQEIMFGENIRFLIFLFEIGRNFRGIS